MIAPLLLFFLPPFEAAADKDGLEPADSTEPPAEVDGEVEDDNEEDEVGEGRAWMVGVNSRPPWPEIVVCARMGE